MAKLLIVQVAALGWDLLQSHADPDPPFSFFPLEPVFPALTCPAQATFRTGLLPGGHGMLANGVFSPELRKVLFWEQSAALVEGPRIWEPARARGKTVGMLFWQQSLGECAEWVLSPKPVHKHSGGMIQDCFSWPEALYEEVKGAVGRGFNLMHYWGPLASGRSSKWIVAATRSLMARSEPPDILFTYLPNLDYDLQRYGPASPQAGHALQETFGFLAELGDAARTRGYEICIYGDYAIGPAERGAVFPNRHLRRAGWFDTHTVKGMAYPDFFHGRAFAMVDHEIAHVYVLDRSVKSRVLDSLSALAGVERVLHGDSLEAAGLAHSRCGDAVLVAEAGHWFAYPWWEERREAPDYATHIDIHNKPGYDPCELFWGWPPPRVSLDTWRVKGTHGKTGPGRAVACASTLPFPEPPQDLLALSGAVKAWMGHA